MTRMAGVSLAVLILLLANAGVAENTPSPCEPFYLATITGGEDSIHRVGGLVTAPVTAVAPFLKAGDLIGVSGIADSSFNGGPFVVESVSSSELQWWQMGATNADSNSNGNGVILPVVGTPDLIVGFSGTSGQFSVAPASDKNSAYTFSYGSLTEFTPEGNVERRHSADITGKNVAWLQPYTNGADASAGTYTFVRLCGRFLVGENTVNSGSVSIEADHFICAAGAGCQGPAVPEDTIQFGFRIINFWPFISRNNTLQLQFRINLPNQLDVADTQRSNGKITKILLTPRQGATLQISFPEKVTIVDWYTFQPVQADYSVDAKVSNSGIDIFATFPSSLSLLDWSGATIQFVQ